MQASLPHAMIRPNSIQRMNVTNLHKSNSDIGGVSLP